MGLYPIQIALGVIGAIAIAITAVVSLNAGARLFGCSAQGGLKTVTVTFVRVEQSDPSNPAESQVVTYNL